MNGGDSVRGGMGAVTIINSFKTFAMWGAWACGRGWNMVWSFLVLCSKHACVVIGGVNRERPIMREREGIITGADSRR